MEKIKVIALKSFDYGGTIRTPQSQPFEVDKLDFTYFVSNDMVKRFHEQDHVADRDDEPQHSNIDEEPQPKSKTKKKAKKDVTDNA
ncbi:hypothetical protein [Gilliamella apicola]|uniref:hypothetical protein n=1 Tax=Gilliamella apicola TaxID=1196095 RepID=UPI0016425ED7|nr:hypothetical protein [Gilliamella apicola]